MQANMDGDAGYPPTNDPSPYPSSNSIASPSPPAAVFAPPPLPSALSRPQLAPLGGLPAANLSQRLRRLEDQDANLALAAARLKPLDLSGESQPDIPVATRLDFGKEQIKPPPLYGQDGRGPLKLQQFRKDLLVREDGGDRTVDFRPAQEYLDDRSAGPIPYSTGADALQSAASTQRSESGRPVTPPHPHGNQALTRGGEEAGGGGGGGGAFPGAIGSPTRPLATPMRIPFSPHALGKDAAARLQTPQTADKSRQIGSANPPMSSIEELLEPPALQPYIPYFQRLKYTDLDQIMDFDDDKTDWMLDEVEAEAEAGGTLMRGAHKNHILTRIKQERIKRANAQPQKLRQQAMQALQQQQQQALNTVSAQPAPTGVVMIDGVRGLLKHWCCCLGLCVLLMIIGMVFIILYERIGRDAITSSGGLNGGSTGSTSSGGWQFVYVISILSFIFGGFACIMSVFSWMRNPDTRNCNCSHLMPDCKNCNLKGLCSCPEMDCDCCSNCGCSDACGQLKECMGGCWLGLREQCHMPECPQCECGDCGCTQCAAECGCADCRDCCSDCQMPTCDCNCCPDCEGDCNSCCSTLYKVCCCQCKIQVS